MAHGIFHKSGTGSSARKLFVFYSFLAFFAAAGNSASNESAPERLVPWQPNPSRRGALAILESCVFTIDACTWSIQHLNVPAPTDRPSAQIWRKTGATVLTVLLPVTMPAHAIVERAAAIQSLQDLKNGHDLQAPGSVEAGVEMGEPRTRLPARHRCRQGEPKAIGEEIKDKSKTDLFTKGIAVLQISELILSLIAKAARHRAISQLEVITVAFSSCAVVTYCFSWNKPQDVQTATTILIPRPLSDKEERDVMALQPEELLVLLAGTATEIRAAQFKRILNGSIELSDNIVQPVFVWLTSAVMLFGAIHLAAWNFAFPSKAERIMWRISSTEITGLPLFSLLNSSMSSTLHAAKEVRDFQNSLLSLQEDYFAYSSASCQFDHENPFPDPVPLRPVYLGELVVDMPTWRNREQQVAALRTLVSTLSPTPWNQIRTENFEWFMTDFMECRFEARRQSAPYVSRIPLEQGEILRGLRKRAGSQVSTLDRLRLS